jgi:hypothetical protein
MQAMTILVGWKVVAGELKVVNLMARVLEEIAIIPTDGGCKNVLCSGKELVHLIH